MEITQVGENKVHGMMYFLIILFSLTVSFFGSYYVFDLLAAIFPRIKLVPIFLSPVVYGFTFLFIAVFSVWIMKKLSEKYNHRIIAYAMLLVIAFGLMQVAIKL
jgi:hypothetical protein